MRLIIAGGRDYIFNESDVVYLLDIAEGHGVTEIVSGGAKGADKCGEIWAMEVGLPVTKFEAEWAVYGRSAGPKRNIRMAKYADAVVLFPGGKGTTDMYNTASKYNLKIFDRRNHA